jgi:hypothetical protein
MPPDASVISLVFLVLGAVLFVYRLGYMLFQGQPWNNPPTVLSWTFTLFLVGCTMLGEVIGEYSCTNGCTHANVVWMILISATVTGVSFTIFQCYERGNGFIDKKTGQLIGDMPYSGFDFVLLGVGAAMRLVSAGLGSCPESCE